MEYDPSDPLAGLMSDDVQDDFDIDMWIASPRAIDDFVLSTLVVPNDSPQALLPAGSNEVDSSGAAIVPAGGAALVPTGSSGAALVPAGSSGAALVPTDGGAVKDSGKTQILWFDGKRKFANVPNHVIYEDAKRKKDDRTKRLARFYELYAKEVAALHRENVLFDDAANRDAFKNELRLHNVNFVGHYNNLLEDMKNSVAELEASKEEDLELDYSIAKVAAEQFMEINSACGLNCIVGVCIKFGRLCRDREDVTELRSCLDDISSKCLHFITAVPSVINALQAIQELEPVEGPGLGAGEV